MVSLDDWQAAQAVIMNGVNPTVHASRDGAAGAALTGGGSSERTRRVQVGGIDGAGAIIHHANAVQWSCDGVSRRVGGHGDRPSQSGLHTLEAVASAQRRLVLQRKLTE